MNLPIENEQQAAAAILFSCALYPDKVLTEAEIRHLSRLLLGSVKFAGHSLDELTVKALSLQALWGSKPVIQQCAPLIEADFAETLFAMACELMTGKGKVSQEEIEILGLAAHNLDVSLDLMKMMLATYLIRNRWNAVE